jgi:hypothetical protein
MTYELPACYVFLTSFLVAVVLRGAKKALDWFLAGPRDCSLFYRIQSSSGAYPTSCPMIIRGSFPWGKAASA